MAKVRKTVAGALLVAAGVSAAWALGIFRRDGPADDSPPAPRPIGRMVRLAGGTFRMGNRLYADRQPVHEVCLRPFAMDEHEVTNGQFARFVAETGCITTAEQRGWSNVYDQKQKRWLKCEGADWRHPAGPHTSTDGRENYPVVHVSWYDAEAYAKWAGKQLPTEAQWEYGARAGLRDADYPWGREELIDGRYQANYWQHDDKPAADGYAWLAPVRSYPPNRFGLYDVAGNVWEWCADWYGEDYYRDSRRENPPGPEKGQLKVQRGGSWLSPENFRLGHHVSARGKRLPEETSQHIGFRCVKPAE
ncbi:MAG: formylglycine-generating enzyme family protein [Pirellulales bacterium]|nr:formylglycine-generating enzyme family protein [Pirellulales bacterium]